MKAEGMKYSAILFDMDGTLFDTERIYRDAWLKAGIPEELYYQFIGQSEQAIRALIRQNTSLDPDTVYADKKRYTAETVSKGIKEKPGMEETLKVLRRLGYKTAIATSSGLEVAENYLEMTGTADLFDAVVSGHGLTHGKPAPDIWLKAASELGYADTPEKCVVVEDSYNGVRSGYAAGMTTIMIPDLVPPDEEMQKKSAAILCSLSEIPYFLEKA